MVKDFAGTYTIVYILDSRRYKFEKDAVRLHANTHTGRDYDMS